MQMKMIFQGKNDPPQLQYTRRPRIDRTHIDLITLCLIEGGMASGEPSVIIVSENEDGSVLLATSLDKYLAGAVGMMAAAESRWGWKRPEGYATLMPMRTEERKALLESIKKELEEWDE